jgi:sec-independent protein translocase protein TatC
VALRAVGHEDRLSIVEHLDELRSRLIACVIALVACFAFTYWQNDAILELVGNPLKQTQNTSCEEVSNDPLEQSACFSVRSADAFRALGTSNEALSAALTDAAGDQGVPATTERKLTAAALAAARSADLARLAALSAPKNRERQPITVGVAEPFTVTFVVAGYAALLLALPFLLYQGYAFVLPAFTPQERRTALPLMLLVPVLFVAGVAFGYFVALPRAVDFLQNFNDDNFDILVGAREYFKFAVVFMAIFGLLFQVPIGVLLITRLGIVTTQQLRSNRGYIVLGVAVVAAVATPTPDPVTMLLAMAPLLVLFEGSILIARIFEKRGGTFRRWSWDDDDFDDLDDLEDLEDDPRRADAGATGDRLP